jgi:hypothetical protein
VVRRVTRPAVVLAVSVMAAIAVIGLVLHDWDGSAKVEREIRYRTAVKAASYWRGRYQSVATASQARSDTISKLVVTNTQLGRRAADYKSRADSLQQSRVGPNEEADARLAENLILRNMLANDSAQIRILTIDRDAWKNIAAQKDTLVADLVRVAEEQHDKKDCSFLRFLPCPNRKAVAVGGLIVGVLIAREVGL